MSKTRYFVLCTVLALGYATLFGRDLVDAGAQCFLIGCVLAGYHMVEEKA